MRVIATILLTFVFLRFFAVIVYNVSAHCRGCYQYFVVYSCSFFFLLFTRTFFFYSFVYINETLNLVFYSVKRKLTTRTKQHSFIYSFSLTYKQLHKICYIYLKTPIFSSPLSPEKQVKFNHCPYHYRLQFVLVFFSLFFIARATGKCQSCLQTHSICVSLPYCFCFFFSYYFLWRAFICF